jgi:hypothetical protein
MKNANKQIKGNCVADGFKELLQLDTLDFAASGRVQADSDSGTVYQTSMSVSVPFGPWVGELQQRLFHGEILGDVDIIEIEQKVVNGKKEWKKIREIKLLESWVESMSHQWSDIHGAFSLTLQYTDMTFSVGDKIAHFSGNDKSA